MTIKNKQGEVAEKGGVATKPPKLLDLMRETIRYKHYSLRTECSYID